MGWTYILFGDEVQLWVFEPNRPKSGVGTATTTYFAQSLPSLKFSLQLTPKFEDPRYSALTRVSSIQGLANSMFESIWGARQTF